MATSRATLADDERLVGLGLPAVFHRDLSVSIYRASCLDENHSVRSVAEGCFLETRIGLARMVCKVRNVSNYIIVNDRVFFTNG